MKGVLDVTEAGEMAFTIAQAGDGEITVVSHRLVKWWLLLKNL